MGHSLMLKGTRVEDETQGQKQEVTIGITNSFILRSHGEFTLQVDPLGLADLQVYS